ncbi:LOW QUALITY PROTEIN: mucin-2-like [Argopecten irradians]|uniref:LOW QUALITY PROTEIN: mucin-2-like n=1 Tax=Argopecten irradians TaxID=31199 RepID=UPI003718A6E4
MESKLRHLVIVYMMILLLDCRLYTADALMFRVQVHVDPCMEYEEIPADIRRSPTQTERRYDESICDVLVREKWYRFVGEAGGDLTNTSVDVYQCSNLYPLWMVGSFPDVGDGIVYRNVCLTSIFAKCHRTFIIQVKNCCSYRVYRLQSPGLCPSAYCLSPSNISSEDCRDPTTTTLSPTTTPTPATTESPSQRTTTTTTLSPTTTPTPTPTASSNPAVTNDTMSARVDPCIEYEEIPADIRRSPNQTERRYDESICDVLVREKWYRFVGEAGGDLTNTSVDVYQCSNLYPLWMVGSFPDVGDGIVYRNVCLTSIFAKCHRTFIIQVKNCCSYRVYRLQSPGLCPSAYCLSPSNIRSEDCRDPTTTTLSPTTTPTPASTTTESPTQRKVTTTTLSQTTTPTPAPTVTASSNPAVTNDTMSARVDPCIEYEEIPADIRRSPNQTERRYDESICDVLVREKWYRFVGEAGGDLTNTSVDVYQCSNLYPLWMVGSFPDVDEGIVYRNVCLTSIFAKCHRTFIIQVKNCCSYRVYRLQSPGLCPSAYCLSPSNISSEDCRDPTTTTLSPTTTPTPASTTTESPTQRTTSTTTLSPTTTPTPAPTVTASSNPAVTNDTMSARVDPCIEYEEIPADIRRSPTQTERRYDESICDVLVREKWYRFVGEAGGDLTNTSVDVYQCSNLYPLWMVGSFPDVGDGIVYRNVCLTSIFAKCHRTFIIQLKNCCSYRVYRLQSPGLCPSAYCLSPSNISSEDCRDPTTTTLSPTTTPTPASTTTESPTQRTATTTTLSPYHSNSDIENHGITYTTYNYHHYIIVNYHSNNPAPTVTASSNPAVTNDTISARVDPCIEYEEIPADIRRSPNQTERRYDESICDVLVREKWYRFVGEAGGDLTNTSVDVYQCSNLYPLWMVGSFPDVGDGIVYRNVCLTSIFAKCHRTFIIQVKNCCSYRVYRLQSPGLCPSAYCLSPSNISSEDCRDPTTTTLSPTTTPTPVSTTTESPTQRTTTTTTLSPTTTPTPTSTTTESPTQRTTTTTTLSSTTTPTPAPTVTASSNPAVTNNTMSEVIIHGMEGLSDTVRLEFVVVIVTCIISVIAVIGTIILIRYRCSSKSRTYQVQN